MGAYEPHNWLGIVGLVILAAGAIIPAWLAAHRGRKATVQAGEMLNQVRNGHDTPLRTDVDRLIDGQENITKLVTDIHSLVVDHNRQIQHIRNDVEKLKLKRTRHDGE